MRIACAWVLSWAVAHGAALPAWSEPQEEKEAGAAPSRLARIEVSFKLDPRLTKGLYMGDRWISHPTFATAQPGETATVEARVRGIDIRGAARPVNAHWTPSNPDLVGVAPAEGGRATIIVRGPGESRLQVSEAEASQALSIRATKKDGTLHVEIAQEPPGGTDRAEERARVLQDLADRSSYALGMEYARKLKQQPLDVDPDLFAQGLKDALAGTPLLTEQELTSTLLALQNDVRAKQARQKKELAERNWKQGDAFLAENKAKDGVVVLESGLQYRVLKAGDGPTPGPEDTVVCHYRGTLVDGHEFDSSYRRGKPAHLAVKRVIKGWGEALTRMPVGSKWQLFVPSHLAYGEAGSRGTIGPNATLVFEVELLSIQEGESKH